ncbi:hypothetical protein ACFL6B_06340 [Thermodesulfobacteriota bacterium]
MRKLFLILSITAIHAAFTKIVSIIAFSAVTAGAHESQMPFMGRSLMTLSKVLYFPVLTYAWYPRQFFPGNLVVFPLFINSMLWALVIYIFFVLIKSLFKKKDNSASEISVSS